MSGHQVFGRAERDFDDSAFEPRSSFDFEEEGTSLGHNMAGFQPFSGEELDFNLMNGVYEGADGFDQEFFQARNGPMAGSNPFPQSSRTFNTAHAGASRKLQANGDFGSGARSSVPEPRSAQSTIVDRRSNNVREHFGQITPPQDEGLEPSNEQPLKQSGTQQTRGQDVGKLSNEQRARNAANTRHSRSKNTNKDGQTMTNSEDEGTQKQGKNITLQREKNRIAAAKCRAKKKSANEQQEEMASEFGATNNYLTREIRDLKNQKTELQNFLLAHRPGVCECHGIHDYNFGQAQRLVLNARRHVVEPVSSPSKESAFSTQSPGSEGSGMFSAASHISPPETMGMPSRHASFSGPTNYGFSQGMNPEGMQAGSNMTKGGQHMSQEFAEFLQSSPGGRAGFS